VPERYSKAHRVAKVILPAEPEHAIPENGSQQDFFAAVVEFME
jgi:hypothetical protein